MMKKNLFVLLLALILPLCPYVFAPKNPPYRNEMRRQYLAEFMLSTKILKFFSSEVFKLHSSYISHYFLSADVLTALRSII